MTDHVPVSCPGLALPCTKQKKWLLQKSRQPCKRLCGDDRKLSDALSLTLMLCLQCPPSHFSGLTCCHSLGRSAEADEDLVWFAGLQVQADVNQPFHELRDSTAIVVF